MRELREWKVTLLAQRRQVLGALLLVVLGSCGSGSSPTNSLEPVTPPPSSTMPRSPWTYADDVTTFETNGECDPGADDADVQVTQAMITAYNARDPERLEELSAIDEIWDPSGITFSRQVTWTRISDWASAAQSVDDRLEPVRLIRYGPRSGSYLIVLRSNNVLVSHGINELELGIKIPSSGCTLQRLVAAVNYTPSLCLFYEAFLEDLQQAFDREETVPDYCS